MATDYWQNTEETQIQIKRIISQGNQGAIEWQWSDTDKKTGKKQLATDAIIFELEGGKIKYWREYIDARA
ncbi:nuclear transport factor 2 family protein [Gloeothece verrucosa]|uniref:nuclear transport factor 2 family protein n=1 Tax=Gloeothece verrucosa TaxID=2546359 RepID=UPI000316BA44|nr:nuclear transport factor 2 family protein [Gloeothece verrucosa]